MLSVVIALATGAVSISFLAMLNGSAISELEWRVLSDIRSPRIVLAVFVGAALGIAGAALQGLFRNPLADPGLVGVSSGAALGAIAMIVVGGNIVTSVWLLPYLLPLAAISGAAIVTLLLYFFANRYGNFSVVTMLLIGIAINAMSIVGIGAFEYLSDDTQLRTLVFWMMGSFGKATWPTVIPILALISAAIVALLYQVRKLDLLQLGEQQAQYLGVDVKQLKRCIILSTAVAIGASVALSGIINFVGLIVPHIVRLLGGVNHRLVLPGSMLLGATLMVIADLVSRIIIVPAELPVGLVTSALGAPFFLWLITRVRPQ